MPYCNSKGWKTNQAVALLVLRYFIRTFQTLATGLCSYDNYLCRVDFQSCMWFSWKCRLHTLPCAVFLTEINTALKWILNTRSRILYPGESRICVLLTALTYSPPPWDAAFGCAFSPAGAREERVLLYRRKQEEKGARNAASIPKCSSANSERS